MYVYVCIYMYISLSLSLHIYIYIHRYIEDMPVLRLQSPEGKFAKSREIEPVHRSCCRHGSGKFTEVARLAPSDTSVCTPPQRLEGYRSHVRTFPCLSQMAISS